MAQPVNGDLVVTDDVPGAFADLAVSEGRRVLSERDEGGIPFRLGCSGGSSGERCYARLALRDDLDWSRTECFFADERCVAPDDPMSNQRALRAVLKPRLAELVGFHPMSCADGPGAYEQQLRFSGGLDVLQLGFGPDGHTASLFPGSAALDAPPDQLVATNVDPAGRNPLERMTLTLAGIAMAGLVVIAVTGAEKRDAFARALAGEDLPASRVHAPRVLWLCETVVAKGLV
ncbi:MAG: 6-phosphogluconolactonase [Acidimicrobiales bacterium]